jgi:uncharacterized peroxidase-related enzyme
MSRVTLIDADRPIPAVAEPIAQIRGAFGTVPNMFRAAANSPAALKSLWGAFGALGSGKLGAKLGEQIAVAIANRNACNYCLAAHTALGRKAGATSDEMTSAQAGRSDDPKTAAVLAFVSKVVENRAQVSAADVQTLKAAGFDDEAVVEIIAHIALNTFTNYLNVALDVPVDFPGIKLRPVT